MNFINRAIKNVTRKVSKSVLLAITFFVIGNFVIVGLGVSQAAESAKVLTRKKMRAVVTYSIDYDAVWKYVDSIEDEDEQNDFYQKHYPKITIGDVETLMKDERVKSANSISTQTYYSPSNSSIEFVRLNNNYEQSMDGDNGKSCFFDEETGTDECYDIVEPKFFVKANFFPDMIELQDGEFTIVDGRFYTKEEIDDFSHVVVITSELAELNGLSVGDEITLGYRNPSDINYLKKQGIDVTVEDFDETFEIIGIYDHSNHITPDASNFDWTSPYENPDNMILMPATTTYSVGLEISQKEFDAQAEKNPDDEIFSNPENRPSMENIEKNVYVNDVTILLNDPLEVEDYVEDYKDTLPQFMKLDANNEEFNKLAKPLDTLNLYSNFIVWLVVINAIIIITLVTALTLKTREYEIGVLLSIGASKIKVIAQFFLELAIVAVLGFTLSVVSGSLIANKVGALMLEYQIQESDVEQKDEDYIVYNSVWDTNYTTEVTLDDLLAEYNVSVSPIIIAEIYVLGLGIVFISVIIPSFMIMRFNPKRILMNQN